MVAEAGVAVEAAEVHKAGEAEVEAEGVPKVVEVGREAGVLRTEAVRTDVTCSEVLCQQPAL
jgi:hypothetical protein